jgi:hypothetical protein
MAPADRAERKRQIGRIVSHQAEGRRSLSELAAQRGTSIRAKQPSLEDITEDITEEISSVIREELGKRKSDPAALSVAGPGGFHLSARGWQAMVLALLLALLAAGVLLGRVTAPHEPKTPVTDAAK